MEDEDIASNRADRRMVPNCSRSQLPALAPPTATPAAWGTVLYGTALGVVYTAAAQGKIERVYADETRPVGQGARLTTWELSRVGIPTTLICDNMAASLMAQGKIDAVIVGADRITANGDAANKIGTYGVAVLAMHHGVPFYVAAPASTVDLALEDGSQIPIEQRPGKSAARQSRRRRVGPAFRRLTPAGLIRQSCGSEACSSRSESGRWSWRSVLSVTRNAAVRTMMMGQ